MGLSIDYLVSVVASVLLVMFSAMVHEVAHGWAAHLCGDDTAREAGRLTLDPRAHLDPVGSVVLPIACALLGAPVFAFARPVPYNPARLRHPRRDELVVALAGPVSNLLQALLGVAAFGLLVSLGVGAGHLTDGLVWGLLDLLLTYAQVNLVLCFFNLIPFPPLDGSKVILFLLPPAGRRCFYELEQYAMFVLLLLLWVVPGLLHVDPLGDYLSLTAGTAMRALLQAVL